ncbi:MAG: hypothetical protein ACE14P_07140 [Methanotrichaceae archaeon]
MVIESHVVRMNLPPGPPRQHQILVYRICFDLLKASLVQTCVIFFRAINSLSIEVKELIGASLFGDHSERLQKLFVRAEGCPNARLLLGISAL